jgi:hypothetical protein
MHNLIQPTISFKILVQNQDTFSILEILLKGTKPKERRKLDGDNNKHIRKYLFKNFMIKVKDTYLKTS